MGSLLGKRLKAEILSTDQLRAELWGDASIQGPWPVLEPLLHQRICSAINQGQSVVIDATHARRRWRLALINGLTLPIPVRWVGWWLQTPLATCLDWNKTRTRQVPDPVIGQLAAALADPDEAPQLAEGFEALFKLDPSTGSIQQQIDSCLSHLATSA